MRMKSNYREYAPGKFTNYPLTRDEALKDKIVFYHPTPCKEPCDRPGHEPDSLRYALTGIGKCCAIRDSLHAYNIAVKNGEPTSVSAGKGYYWKSSPGKYCGHVGKTLANGKCAICHDIGLSNPRLRALENGENWYMPTNPCPRCGVVAMRHCMNGRCSNCDVKQFHRGLSPRQKAIERGDKWYFPETPCPLCNEIDWRRIANGKCGNCSDYKPPIYETNRDLIISLNDAKQLGFKFYNIGEKCINCETTWRRVNNNKCIKCKK